MRGREARGVVVGDCVRVTDGEHAGQTGVITEIKSGGHYCIELMVSDRESTGGASVHVRGRANLEILNRSAMRGDQPPASGDTPVVTRQQDIVQAAHDEAVANGRVLDLVSPTRSIRSISPIVSPAPKQSYEELERELKQREQQYEELQRIRLRDLELNRQLKLMYLRTYKYELENKERELKERYQARERELKKHYEERERELKEQSAAQMHELEQQLKARERELLGAIQDAQRAEANKRTDEQVEACVQS